MNELSPIFPAGSKPKYPGVYLTNSSLKSDVKDTCQPLAMGNYETVIEVREKLVREL